MGITAADVKKLRDKTGVAMMDCKKALVSADGDLDKAVDILRTKGQATAEKRAGRTAAEGTVVVRVENGKGVLVEVNCETDFVARNDDFQALATLSAETALKKDAKDAEALLGMTPDGKEQTLAELCTEVTGTIGEKIAIRRLETVKVDDGFVQEYIHGGGRIGVLVGMKGSDGSDEAVKALAQDVAMQVAAMRPQYLCPDCVPEDVRTREMEIQKERVREEGKPENMLEKIAQGRMRKFYSEICLLEQNFVKENKKTVRKVVSETSKDLAITGFFRFEVGEQLDA
jgi:elongation factor Ts